MIITSISYKIGVNIGEYPAGGGITDSFLAMIEKIVAVNYNDAMYSPEKQWVHTKGTPYFGTGNNLPDFVDGQVVTFYFSPAMIIEQA